MGIAQLGEQIASEHSKLCRAEEKLGKGPM